MTFVEAETVQSTQSTREYQELYNPSSTTTMASNPPSGASTPNPRFTSQTKTAEDLLSTQTVGLVNLSDYRKRRAEVIEQKERDVQDAILGAVSGRATPTSDG